MRALKNFNKTDCRSLNEMREHNFRERTTDPSTESARIDRQLDQIRVQLSDLASSTPEPRQPNCSEDQEQDDAIDGEYSNVSVRRTADTASAASVIAVTTSIATESCRPSCHCQCHQSTRYQTPRWARNIIGSFSFRANCSVLLNRAECNYRLCKRSGQTSLRFAYFAPTWLIARALSFAATKRDVEVMNAAIMITMPRVISDYAAIWGCIEHGRTDKIKGLLMSKEASIFDVDKCGDSLLQVMSYIQ
jgi:hypothetical protein